jgi:site-specific recombinase XerC
MSRIAIYEEDRLMRALLLEWLCSAGYHVPDTPRGKESPSQADLAITHNPVKGVSRPKVEGYEGKTPAIFDAQGRAMLSAPKEKGLKAKRDRAILSLLFYHAVRLRDLHDRRGVKHFRIHGKGGKLRYVPVHAGTLEAIADYVGWNC